MEKSDIKKILRNPSKELVDLALGYVNLTEKERAIIEYTEIKGISEERTAETLCMSARHLQKIKREAINKISEVWTYTKLISIMLKEMD